MYGNNCVMLWRSVLRCMSTKPKGNGEINAFVFNRNPRNLEKMRIARKPSGYPFEKGLIEYWHRLTLNQIGEVVTAMLIHNTDTTVITASTEEWAIRKFLYSGSDTQAYITLAKVFAQRCMESGITSMQSDVIYQPGSKSEKFLIVLLKEGLSLEEPPTFEMDKKWNLVRDKRPWTVLEE